MPGVFQLNLSRLFGKKETSLLKVPQCTPCKNHRNNVSTSVCLILMVICRRNNSHQTTYQHLRYATQLHIMQHPNKTISLQTRLVPSYTTCKIRIEIYSKGYNQTIKHNKYIISKSSHYLLFSYCDLNPTYQKTFKLVFT